MEIKTTEQISEDYSSRVRITFLICLCILRGIIMRTKGSGWGAGVILYQVCPLCNKKKAYYDYHSFGSPFKCSHCKEYFSSDTLLRNKYRSKPVKITKHKGFTDFG